MTDHAAEAARSAAAILAPDLGQNLPVEVEIALAARDGERGPDRFVVDLIALGALIVAIATLAWDVYKDQRDRRERKPELSAAVQEPDAEAIARGVRNKLREQDAILPPGTERITQVVVTEIIRQAKEPGS